MHEFDISVISTPYFYQPSEYMGSVEKVSFQRFQQFEKMGYKVNFIAPQPSDNNLTNKQSIKIVQRSKVPDRRNKIHWMYSTRSFDYFMPYLRIPKNKIGRVVFLDGWRLEPWDFIPLSAKFRHSKVVNILHPPVVFIDRLPIRFLSPLYKNTTWGALNTRINAHYHKRGYKSIYLPNGIDIPNKIYIERNPDEYLIFFGRIEPSKAPHLAIRLAEALGMPLRIFGRVYDDKYFETMIKPHLDPEKIAFYGEVSYDQLFENLRKAKATVYFSEVYDPLPTVLLESISFGVPVIGYSTDPLSGFHDIVSDGMNGVILKSTDDFLYGGTEKLISRIDSMGRNNIYALAAKKWSWESVIRQQYQQFLDHFLGN